MSSNNDALVRGVVERFRCAGSGRWSRSRSYRPSSSPWAGTGSFRSRRWSVTTPSCEDFIARNAAAAVAGYVALYIAVVALSLPGGAVLTITGGVLFGVVIGGAAALVGATIGAICIFLIARSAVGEHLVRRAGPLAERLAEGFRADAFSYLLFLRLVPLFPFWLVNLVPALCGVRLATFAAATAIGIIPATFAFAFVGAGLDSVIAAQEAAYRACLAAGASGLPARFPAAGGDHAGTARRRWRRSACWRSFRWW